eukprot:CAMPEP_0168454910 /NCGR_PEP_ID=MMETSP0228-20121227/50467_1 /TAXON_ID=133427 /ORGANISM="Protoceratium reticulatum, Strain CCCM 535 (=CCMP 1889)" /LENGTH=87 /DNA_ID=CAMNT_0008469717 /DNA_START=66 /DNA_END=325 /DNA_ORIENTATION=+
MDRDSVCALHTYHKAKAAAAAAGEYREMLRKLRSARPCQPSCQPCYGKVAPAANWPRDSIMITDAALAENRRLSVMVPVVVALAWWR